MDIRLETREGGFVTTAQILPFQILPEGVMWGARFFILHDRNATVPVYREGLCVPTLDALQPAGSAVATLNGQPVTVTVGASLPATQPTSGFQGKPAPPAPVRDGLTTDRNCECLGEIKDNGQQACYLVLSEEERAKGYVRKVRTKYQHVTCGTVTSMSLAIAETYARKPTFYSGTFCCGCGTHFDLVDGEGKRQFRWIDPNTSMPDGSFVGE